MIFKRIEWVLLTPGFWLWTAHRARFLTTAVAHVFGLVMFMYTLISLNSLVLRSLLFSLSFIFITYWFISIFMYLFKKAQYGTYTRIIQRFWKRALWLFWAIELFLFIIYLFLAIISPQEVSYMLDQPQLVIGQLVDYNTFFNSTFYALLIILTTNVLILTHKYNTYSVALLIGLTLLLLRALYEDFIQFYGINQYYGGFQWVRAKHDLTHDALPAAGVWELDVIELKGRTILHYTYLLIFLKLWHTLFICGTFLFFENARTYSRHTSYNILAVNLQNFYFLFFFNFILKFVALKSFVGHLGSFVYFWFYVNYSAASIAAFYYLPSMAYFW